MIADQLERLKDWLQQPNIRTTHGNSKQEDISTQIATTDDRKKGLKLSIFFGYGKKGRFFLYKNPKLVFKIHKIFNNNLYIFKTCICPLLVVTRICVHYNYLEPNTFSKILLWGGLLEWA